MVVVVVLVAEELRHNMKEHEMYTVKVLIPMRNLCGSLN